MNKGPVGNIDALVYDFFSFATDAILQDRKGMTNPLTSSSTPPFSDNADYNRQALAPFKRDVNRMLVLDLYIFNPYQHKHILIERWKISYQRNTDSKEARPFPIINRRILTLIRTVTCYLRLIPGFSILNLSKVKPSFGYQLYEWRNGSNIPELAGEVMKYKFNSVSTSKGIVNVGVTYLNGPSIKEILRSIESNGEYGASRRHSNPSGFAKEKESSAAIPIPSQQQQHSRGTSLINQRIDEYDDPTTNTSSYNSQEDPHHPNQHQSNPHGHTSRGGPASSTAAGATAAQGSSVDSRGSDDLRRRSFNLTPDQHHNQDHLMQYRQGGATGGSRQHAKSFDNNSGKHFPSPMGAAAGATAPPAESSPSSGGGGNYMHEGVAGLGRPSSTGSRVSSAAVPIAIAGATATAAALGVRHSNGYVSSSASSHSTPPFSLMEQRTSFDTPGTSYPDITKNSPPYQQFSTSLVSTSPGFGNLMNIVNARETYRRRKSFTENKPSSATNAAGISAMNWKPSSSPATDTENDVRMFLTLPKSPFKTAFLEDAQGQHRLSGAAGAAGSEPDNITLDVILYQERRQQYGWNGADPSAKTSSALVPAGHHDDPLDHMQFRNSLESNGNNDEDEGDTEDADDDTMFAFALNPHDLGAGGGGGGSQNHDHRKSLSAVDAHEGGDSGKAVTTMDLMEGFQQKLRDYQNFNVEFNS